MLLQISIGLLMVFIILMTMITYWWCPKNLIPKSLSFLCPSCSKEENYAITQQDNYYGENGSTDRLKRAKRPCPCNRFNKWTY
jgi:hypothetical protein